jgi:hypothetical protein
MERRFSFSTGDKNRPYFDLFKAETLSDGSTYLFLPEIFGKTGAHYSFHSSGECHFRTCKPAATSSNFRIEEFLQDIERKKENFFMRLDLFKVGPGTMGILKMEKILNYLKKNNDLYKIDGKRMVVSSSKFMNLVEEMPIYQFDNLEFDTARMVKNGDISENDIIMATKFGSSSIFAGSPAIGKNCGIFLNLNSRSSLNRLPGFNVLQRPFTQVLEMGGFDNIPNARPLPFFN